MTTAANTFSRRKKKGEPFGFTLLPRALEALFFDKLYSFIGNGSKCPKCGEPAIGYVAHSERVAEDGVTPGGMNLVYARYWECRHCGSLAGCATELTPELLEAIDRGET